MDAVHKVKYNIRDLTTRSVTLFLSRAQIFRDITNVPLKPGSNEITIHGLSPTVDEQSIKVEGSGSAIISDISVEPLPNLELFKDAYPDEDGLEDSDAEEDDLKDDEEANSSDNESEELSDAKAKLQDLLDDLDRANQLCLTAAERQRILQTWGSTLSCEFGADIEDAMIAYQDMRDAANEQHASGIQQKRKLLEPIKAARKQVDQLTKAHDRDRKKAAKERRVQQLARRKEKQKAKREKQEVLEEKRRVRAEKKKFWPKYSYSVRIQLQTNTYTPLSSRRESFSSDLGASSAIDLGSETPKSQTAATASTCNLVLSYVTTSASWSPSYDLQLSTTNSSGRLCFDAQLHNTTSETWDKCKITLSTSQTVFGGVEEVAPTLSPWKIQLQKGGFNNADSQPILKSKAEQEQARRRIYEQKHTGIFKNRSDMFEADKAAKGPLKGGHDPRGLMQRQVALQWNRKKQQAQQQAQQQAHVGSTFGNAMRPSNNAAALFGAPRSGPGAPPGSHGFGGSSGVFGSAVPQPQQAQSRDRDRDLQHSAPQPTSSSHAFGPDGGSDNESSHTDRREDDDDEDPQLDYPESQVEDTGFSTQYDLPGEKRLEPRSHPPKQRVAQVHLSDVTFSHTIVAKYRPAAFLSAKLTNASKLTLLRGAAGVTLDGSFLGRTSLPRCVGGEAISLGLGVDPAVRVVYAPPEGRRATTGFFTKEDITVYDRVLRVENTRSASAGGSGGGAVKLVVLDQIPVPSEERIKVEMIQPEGLVAGAEEGKPAGEPGRTKKEEDKDWGSAKAYLRKSGEVVWYVTLKGGKAVKLDMRYSVAMPIGDQAQEVPS